MTETHKVTDCSCPNITCPRHGHCAACVAHHKSQGNLPSCLRVIARDMYGEKPQEQA